MSNNLFDAVKPLLACWKYLGFISYRVKILDEAKYIQRNWKHFVVSTLFQISICILAVPVYYDLILYHITPDISLVELGAFLIYNGLNFIHLFIIVAIWKLYNEKIIKLMNRLIDVSIKMNDLNIKLDYKRLKKIFKRILIFHILSVGYFGSSYGWSDIERHYSFFISLSVTYSLLFEHSIGGQYVTYVAIVKHILRQLNTDLLKLIDERRFLNYPTNNEVNTEERAKKIVEICEDIFWCVKTIKSMFSLPLLLQFGALTASAVIQVFVYLRTWIYLSSEEPESINYVLIALLLIVATVFCLVGVGTYTIATQMYLNEVKFYFLFLT